jgi:hypothetical protein
MERRDFLTAALAAPLMLHEAAVSAVCGTPDTRIPFLQVGTPNKNKRLYPKTVADKIIRDNKYVMGHIGMADTGRDCSRVSLAHVSHEMHDLQYRNINGVQWLTGELKILNTPEGKTLREMLSINPESVSFRTAGIGSGIVKANDGILVISDNYKLVSVDAVQTSEAT